jgi:hypothetical protein
MVAVKVDNGPIRPAGEQMHYSAYRTVGEHNGSMPIEEAAAGPIIHINVIFNS